jgi:hypothetical protein
MFISHEPVPATRRLLGCLCNVFCCPDRPFRLATTEKLISAHPKIKGAQISFQFENEQFFR